MLLHNLSILLALISLVCAESFSSVEDGSVELVHRILKSDALKPAAWSRRGVVRLIEPPTIEPATLSSLQADIDSRYQLAIKRAEESSWPMVSIPVCRFIGTNLNETITLLLEGEIVSHLSYQTSAKADVCIKTQPGGSSVLIEPARTNIVLQRPFQPEPYRLHAPIVVQYNNDGSVKVPEKEKSFIQKYWMYLVPLLLFTLLSPQDKAQAGGGQGAGGNARPAR